MHVCLCVDVYICVLHVHVTIINIDVYLCIMYVHVTIMIMIMMCIYVSCMYM
jgi:hypothetical protein